ncbi:hypothetical protein QYE76_038534 [Lolium multiflorum]|uniref:N-acetyltransferase domain-containing protein n=1 Tax=Lolium multiflorum TaxID=4521 RepID=A0AAD8WSZ3_LOLMU|nr:hypothetical protein QYE76_038534 [Lolium multiflorum]
MKILKKIAGNLREEHERKREQSELLKPIDAGLTSADSRRPPLRCSGRRTVDSLHASLLPSAAALQPEQRRRLAVQTWAVRPPSSRHCGSAAFSGSRCGERRETIKSATDGGLCDHVSCIRSKGDQLECCPEGPWLCSQKCSNIFQRLQGLVGRSVPTSVEGLSFTLFRSSKLPEEEAMAAEEHGKLRMAFDVLHECFVTLIEPKTQSDLSHDIVFNRESWLRRLNFRGFNVVGIEKGGELITVGTLRVYGDKVAELPLVGTRFAHRRRGMCHLLMNNLEKLLGELGVERLVLPAVPELLQTWTESFGFQVMSQSDKLEIAEHTILCFQGTTMCHKFINKAAAPQR